MYALMDYHLTWYKCCPHWDDVHISKNILVTNQTTCITYFPILDKC